MSYLAETIVTLSDEELALVTRGKNSFFDQRFKSNRSNWFW